MLFVIMFLFSCSLKMNIQPTTESSTPLTIELEIANIISIRCLFDNSVFNAALNPLTMYLKKEKVDQNVLDGCLLYGFQILQRKDQEICQVAPKLQLLLQHGAQWKDGALLEHQMTPSHLICQSTGDHHELLDWMLKLSDKTLINTKDNDGFTALFYAVQNANINCIRTLLANGAEVYVGTRCCSSTDSCIFVRAIKGLQPDSVHSSSIMTKIFDLLLKNVNDINKCRSWNKSYASIHYALHVSNVECATKLIKKAANLNARGYNINDFWVKAARLGNVKLVKCLLDHGVDKDITDEYGRSLLSQVVTSGDVEAVRYLLDIEVTVTSYTPKMELKPCQECRTNRLTFYGDVNNETHDPCTIAVRMDEPKILQMLIEHGSQSCHSFNALRHALMCGNVGVLEYLLNKYSYPLNVEYSTFNSPLTYSAPLAEPCCRNATKITKLLLDHGGDPNMRTCVNKGSSILLAAIKGRHTEVIALYIRNGVDINFRSFDSQYGVLLPFEASALHNRLDVTEMLLVSGCSYGMFSLENNQKIKYRITSDIKDLMKNWDVRENKVKPLQQQCRRMILNHLSPQAEKKITKMPLPSIIIKYLSVPELDDILTSCKNSTRHQYKYTNQ